MTKKFIFSLVIFITIAALIAALILTKKDQFAAMEEAGKEGGPPPSSVSTFKAEIQTWERSINAVGTVASVQGVLLEAEAGGVVREINFKNGEQVEAGALLIQLDIEVEFAQLRAAKANATLAQTEFDRSKTLRASGSIPQSQLDSNIASLETANAEIENIKAVIDRKTIRAPFSGKVGIREVNLGQYVSQGAPLVALQSYDSVFVNFSLPQQTLSKLNEGMQLSLTSDVYPERTFIGSITAISPQIDSVTRSISVQGTLKNKEELLRPGLFARVKVVLNKEDTFLVVPTTAISYAPYGNSIYVIEQTEDGGSDLIAKQHFIRTGRRLGDFISVLEGLNENDEVVSAGVFKLKNGTTVTVNNEMPPSPRTDPQPDNS